MLSESGKDRESEMKEVKKTGSNKIYDEIQINAQPSEEPEGMTINSQRSIVDQSSGPFR